MTSSTTLLSDSPQKSNLATALAPGRARSHFVINVASNMAYVVGTSVLMLWYTPFLIRYLGVAAYGIVPLANSVVTYMSIATEGLNIAIYRFLAIDLNRADITAANRMFNTALSISAVVVGALLPVGLIVAWLFPAFFQVPAGLENEARWIFGSVALTFFLTILGSNFSISALVFHRFDLQNLVKGLTMVTRVGLVVLLFTLLPARLWHVGVGFATSAVVSFVGNWWLWRKLTPHLQVMPSAFDRTRLGELLNLSIWAIVNRAGMLLFLSVDLIVVNLFFGARVTGQYGTLLLLPELIRVLAETVSSVLSPAIMARYAVRDFEGMRQLASRAVKLMGIGLALPVGLMGGFAQPLLNIWLGPDFWGLNILLIILVGHLSTNWAILPLAYVLTSYNKVRVQGTVTLIFGVVNAGLAIILAWWGIWGAMGVAAATAITLTANHLFFLSGYSASVMNLRWWTFYPALIRAALDALGVGLSGYGLTQIWWPTGWSVLAGQALLVSIGYCVMTYFVRLNREDRQFLLDMIPSSIRGALSKKLRINFEL